MQAPHLIGQYSNAGSSFLNNLAVAFASTLLQILSSWINKTTTDQVQEWRDGSVDPNIIALNIKTLTDTATSIYSGTLLAIAQPLKLHSTFGSSIPILTNDEGLSSS